MKGAIEMMNLNHTTIIQIIHDLNRSIGLHNTSLDSEECWKNQIDEVNESNCYHCQLEDIIDDLDCLKSHLIPIAKSTISSIQFVDAEAFRFALAESGQFNSVRCYPTFIDDNGEYNYNCPKDADGFAIEVTIERYAMDGNGYHVGYESATFKWNCIDKHELGIAGIPYLLSKWVVNPEQYELIQMDHPKVDDPDHDPDCELNKEDSDGDCDCGAFESMYYPADDDFWYSEMDSRLDSIEYPDAEYNPDKREWQLGDMSYSLEEFNSDELYKDNAIENDGAPYLD